MALFGFFPDRAGNRAPAAEPVSAAAMATETARIAALQPAIPGPRELRAQAVHRLQVGLFGLAGMLLLVSLANVIMDRAKQVDVSTASSAALPSASAGATSANDPLVDMGVAPELPVGSAPKPRATPRPRPN
jgi:hypothetical protein